MSRPQVVLCNGAQLGSTLDDGSVVRALEYRPGQAMEANVKIGLPDFVRRVHYLPDRLRDLVEIAAYVYCADRSIKRGELDAREYHSWGRDLRFRVKVRDYEFWQDSNAAQQLAELLCFLAGEETVHFEFERGHETPPTSLFDQEGIEIADNSEVALFSGGVDSLTGALEHLVSTDAPLALVSHTSGQPSTTRTQKKLFEAIDRDWPGSTTHLAFHCNLTGGKRAAEESQRSRFFLYASIAYAIAHATGQKRIWAYENGITSLNFPKRQDLMNARASRTTHPRTIMLLSQFFSEVEEEEFSIETPFFWKTKTDVMQILAESGGASLLSSSVSCSKTFKASAGTQCGGCSQCIDRRFAAFAAGLEDSDQAGYATDFIREDVADLEVRAALTEYVHQACRFEENGVDQFYTTMAADLAMVVDSIPGMNEEDAVHKLWQLTRRHGQQVLHGLQRMREVADDPHRSRGTSTLLRMIENREYLAPPPIDQQQPRASAAREVFISYSHKDEGMCEQLKDQLMALKHEGLVHAWYDRKIGPGKEWEGEIDEHLNSANIILLLVSPKFISSEYCYDVEMTRAMERHEAQEATVVPVIIRDCVWDALPFGKLLALPQDGVPVNGTKWKNRDQAFAHIVRELRDMIRSGGHP